MSALEETFEAIVRKVVREELGNIQPRDEGLMTVEDVVAFLRYAGPQSVYKLKREGKLTPVYLGESTMRFEKSEVQRFIRESRKEPE